MKTMDRINIIRDFAMSSENPEDASRVFNMWLEIYNEMATGFRLGAKEYTELATKYNELVSNFNTSVDLNSELLEKYITVRDKYAKLLEEHDRVVKLALEDAQRLVKFIETLKRKLFLC